MARPLNSTDGGVTSGAIKCRLSPRGRRVPKSVFWGRKLRADNPVDCIQKSIDQISEEREHPEAWWCRIDMSSMRQGKVATREFAPRQHTARSSR